MGRLAEKIVLGIVALFLLAYVAYQAYNYIYGSMKTETAFEYTVSRSISVEGVAIRSEFEITGNINPAYIQNFVYEDGVRVTAGETVVEFFDANRTNSDVRRARQIEDEIKMLEEAQDGSVNNFSTTEILNRDIKEQLTSLTMISHNGRFSGSGEIKSSLTALINKKQIATGVVTSFELRINTLREQYDQLDISDTGGAIMPVKAPKSGFFSGNVDGYVGSLSIQGMAGFKTTDYLNVIDTTTSAYSSKRTLGKIVTDQNWIFAASAPKEELEFVRPGQDVFISFDSVGRKIPAVVSDVMQERNADRAVLIISCNQVSGDLLKIRKSDAVINFSQFTGLRVNMSDVRFQGEKRGVYVLENNTVRFREIDAIYEEQSFVLSRLLPPDTREKEYVNLFDQIITKGNDLYDGKVML